MSTTTDSKIRIQLEDFSVTDEIEAMKNSLSGIIQSISVKQLKKGMNYLIPEGPFKGSEGTVVANSKHKIKLQLAGLGILVTLTLA